MGRYNSQPLQKLKSNRLRMFFKIGSIKNRLQYRCFLWILWNFKNIFFNRTPPMAASNSRTTIRKVCCGVCSLISRLHLLSSLIKKLVRNVAQIILYYHDTKQFLPCWIDWSHACDIRICFGKALIVIDFDEKLHKALHK